MKKKLLIIGIAFILTVGLMGCSDDKTNEVKQPASQSEAVQQEEIPVENKDNESLDRNLSGMDLLKSLDYTKPESMKMVAEITAFNTNTTTTMYVDGKNSRMESDIANMGKSVVIVNDDEEAVYTYMEGQGAGTKILGADATFAEDMDMMMDLGSKFQAYAEETGQVLDAKVEDLEGKEVIYLKSTETDEESGEVTMHMWYSPEYGTALKYEVIMGDSTVMTFKVTDIERNANIDKDLFKAPSDINFTEVSMDTMKQMMEE